MLFSVAAIGVSAEHSDSVDNSELVCPINLTEKQKERLVELLNEATFGVNVHTLADHLSRETIERVAEYLMANGVIVPPIMVYPEVTAQVYYEDWQELWVRNQYTYTWEEERKILKAEERNNAD